MVKLVEVGPRDGLQNEKSILSTEDKFQFISLLVSAGLKDIEVSSFVKAPAIPQMADATQLFAKVRDTFTREGNNFPCLVPNLKGYEAAKAAGVKEIALFTATSDSFTKKNINATIEESFLRLKEVADVAQKDGIRMRGYVSTAFGCPYEGKTSVTKLVEVSERLLKLGVFEVSIGDTIGVAVPSQVRDVLNVLKNSIPVEKLAMHFHDTRGMALTNILMSLDGGITSFDSSAGGIGGCPYAKGATGNVATEDVWYLLHSQGLETGINIDKLIAASDFIFEKLGRISDSKFIKAYKNTGRI
jgi:hydroxymethylglutaryl-CoA lyase